MAFALSTHAMLLSITYRGIQIIGREPLRSIEGNITLIALIVSNLVKVEHNRDIVQQHNVTIIFKT